VYSFIEDPILKWYFFLKSKQISFWLFFTPWSSPVYIVLDCKMLRTKVLA